MLISCQSFGFRNGLPQDADLVFDVRCLPNPYYVPELKEHDGTEGPVRDYVMNAPESHEMLQKLEELLAFSIPLYQREGKSQLVVAVGFLTGIRTTGGKGLFCRKKDADAKDSRRRSREIRNAPGTYAEKHGRRIPW